MLVTPDYYAEQSKRLKELHEKLATIRKNKKQAFENCGDGWHDNPFYHHLMHDERMTENLIMEEDQKISQFQLFDINSVSNHPEEVMPGTNVKVIEHNMKTGTQIERVLGIVPLGAEDFDNSVFAYSAPRVKPLIGAKVGDIRIVSIPVGTLKIQVLGISKFPFNQSQCIVKQKSISGVIQTENRKREPRS